MIENQSYGEQELSIEAETMLKQHEIDVWEKKQAEKERIANIKAGKFFEPVLRKSW